MKYLFIGGSEDGKHHEMPDNEIQANVKWTMENGQVRYEHYTKKMLCYHADVAACSVFAQDELTDSAIIWRLVNGYKKA